MDQTDSPARPAARFAQALLGRGTRLAATVALAATLGLAVAAPPAEAQMAQTAYGAQPVAQMVVPSPTAPWAVPVPNVDLGMEAIRTATSWRLFEDQSSGRVYGIEQARDGRSWQVTRADSLAHYFSPHVVKTELGRFPEPNAAEWAARRDAGYDLQALVRGEVEAPPRGDTYQPASGAEAMVLYDLRRQGFDVRVGRQGIRWAGETPQGVVAGYAPTAVAIMEGRTSVGLLPGTPAQAWASFNARADREGARPFLPAGGSVPAPDAAPGGPRTLLDLGIVRFTYQPR